MKADLRPFKKLIREKYPEDHPLQVVLTEPDLIERDRELIGKIEVWIKLSHWRR